MIKLKDNPVHDNGVYSVYRILESPNDETFMDNWAVVNNEHETVEQIAYVLPSAISTADQLAEILRDMKPVVDKASITRIH